MTCYVCRYYFCYICEGPVGQCVCDTVPVRSKYLRFLVYSLLFTILFSAIPMVLVIGAPIACTWACLQFVGNDCCGYNYDHEELKCVVPGAIVGINCGLLFSPLAIIGALCVGPFFVCYGAGAFAYDQYQNRKYAQEQAEQAIEDYNRRQLEQLLNE